MRNIKQPSSASVAAAVVVSKQSKRKQAEDSRFS